MVPAGCDHDDIMVKLENINSDYFFIKQEAIDSDEGRPGWKTSSTQDFMKQKPADAMTKKRSRKQDQSMIVHAPSKRRCTTWFSGVVPFVASNQETNASSSDRSSKKPVLRKQQTRYFCEHGKRKDCCTECTPSLLCEHGKWKSARSCRICFKGQPPKKQAKKAICEHGK